MKYKKLILMAGAFVLLKTTFALADSDQCLEQREISYCYDISKVSPCWVEYSGVTFVNIRTHYVYKIISNFLLLGVDKNGRQTRSEYKRESTPIKGLLGVTQYSLHEDKFYTTGENGSFHISDLGKSIMKNLLESCEEHRENFIKRQKAVGTVCKE